MQVSSHSHRQLPCFRKQQLNHGPVISVSGYRIVSGTATAREVRKEEKKNPKQDCGTGDIGEEETLNENGTGLGAKEIEQVQSTTCYVKRVKAKQLPCIKCLSCNSSVDVIIVFREEQK